MRHLIERVLELTEEEQVAPVEALHLRKGTPRTRNFGPCWSPFSPGLACTASAVRDATPPTLV